MSGEYIPKHFYPKTSSCLHYVILFFSFIAGAATVDTDAQYRLVRDLLKPYDKRVRPALNFSESLNVTFGVALAQIIDVDEKNQIITTNCWLNQGWLDPKLRWEPKKYGNITVVRIPFKEIWLPDIVLYNTAEVTSADFSSVSTNVIVTHDGNVTWLSMVIFKSSCSIDVQYFPFDEQNCSMSFSSWTYDAYQVNILNVGTEGDTSNYMNSTEWNLINFVQEREVVIFSCCPEPYIFINYHILIKRRPLFYMFNLVVPCLLITLVSLLGFYMPSDSGEKISMGITTLLSMTVFLMIVADMLPPTSDVLPLIGLYYGITIAVVSSATAMTVLTLNIHHKGQRGQEIPGYLRTIFFGVLAKVLFIKVDSKAQAPERGMHPIPQSDYYMKYENETLTENGGLSPRFTRKIHTAPGTPSSHTTDNTERQFMRVLQKVYQTIEKNEMRLADQDRRDHIKYEWQQLALILDRCLLIVFMIITTCVTLGIFLPSPHSTAFGSSYV
ncbi:ligand-gated ion channel 4-like isoform X2 [Gigantopelta aegis]|uniref:ligand-gated ion channel 4-like isoform X2 n=1 Tax=Gigantopelta aegis TaxID=1735272 RepID=UPI001B88C4B3|nr:ligand-gated ion channel 4-like isoform X2 [Gigantopelta aegis]XP_041365682.1 ligand-gated ion channel 4-like isoform X2 [Gigantopelta aegis]XP_041365683.1 ligand-gated ion channel 4-like isoform X2 [Gigantopelta aegis]XP_041365684.1 ligand-gated ion channel 4-like isoform X2 [Gigantopelta aegis]